MVENTKRSDYQAENATLYLSRKREETCSLLMMARVNSIEERYQRATLLTRERGTERRKAWLAEKAVLS